MNSPTAVFAPSAAIPATRSPASIPMSDQTATGEATARRIITLGNRLGRLWRWLSRTVATSFNLASLIALLAVAAAVPVIQLVTLGYTVGVAGRIASGQSVLSSMPGLRQAGRVGLAAIVVFVFALPTKMLVHWASVAGLLGSPPTTVFLLHLASWLAAGVTLVYLCWAWIRGGRLVDYLWPAPVRFVKSAWHPSTWSTAADRLWRLTGSFDAMGHLWLGIQTFVGTLIWLIPAMLIIAANRNGKTGLAGLIGVLSLLALGLAMFYLPMLQVQFARERRFRALFDVKAVRLAFRRSPWAYTAAMLVSLVLAPIPLYLLKIEATPREVVWLPCVVFVTFMLPARVCAGLAMRRARRFTEVRRGFWPTTSRVLARLSMVPIVGLYLLFVYLSQYTSWDGLQTWIQQHAILVPYPFLGV
ncbi:DUF4013 domain-containing protein [Crateriforma conspicua]|uniref:DUF4013 domain-containing protein n=1 Tax=Crateriforma conspicua TaxID=2527996 RepID=UPI00118934B8|nr:DUF4013 domain-containing protein [Crateriforma conspicua]QDV64331.1 hypothetical protein Mal65_34850 [Crateriforma conspicua]